MPSANAMPSLFAGLLWCIGEGFAFADEVIFRDEILAQMQNPYEIARYFTLGGCRTWLDRPCILFCHIAVGA